MRKKPVFDMADFAIAERWIEKTSDCICLAAEEVIESYRQSWHEPDWGQSWGERLDAIREGEIKTGEHIKVIAAACGIAADKAVEIAPCISVSGVPASVSLHLSWRRVISEMLRVQEKYLDMNGNLYWDFADSPCWPYIEEAGRLADWWASQEVCQVVGGFDTDVT